MTKVYFLTKRQREVLEALRAMSVKKAAEKLGIEPSTVYSIRRNVKEKIKEAMRIRRKYHDVLYLKKRR